MFGNNSNSGFDSTFGGGGITNNGVQSVRGLDTDNTDPQNPIVNISVDGTTISGYGTPDSPLQANIPASNNYGLYSQTQTSTPITNTTSELSLIGNGVGTLSVPANAFVEGDSFTAKMFGHISSLNTATLQIRTKSNGVLLGDTGVVALATTTNQHWSLEFNFTIQKIGATGVASIVCGCNFNYIKDAGVTFEGTNFVNTNNSTFDTTISNTLEITAQWNTSSASNSIYSNIFVLNKIY